MVAILRAREAFSATSLWTTLNLGRPWGLLRGFDGMAHGQGASITLMVTLSAKTTGSRQHISHDS
ncbi:MAG: hypothetical protein ACYCXT_03900 [Acidiferrobacteraceae bacterium]